MKKDDLGFSTRAIHTSIAAPDVPSTPIAIPIHQTASFAFDGTTHLDAALEDLGSGFVYSRLTNPTVDALERGVADLERGGAALAFSSGMAAIHGALIGTCKSGDHIVAPSALYGGSFGLMKKVLPRYGVTTTFVENGDLEAIKAAMRPETKVVYTETIANPNLAVADLPALARIAHDAQAKLVVDNTFASPYLCRPIEHGADIVVHSASKYLGGHGDLIGGMLIGGRDEVTELQRLLIEVGGAMAPFVAWLVLRGLKTLSLRMNQHTASAQQIAEALDARDDVRVVHYPGLPNHPDHEVAKRTLSNGFGGMVAFELVGGDRARVSRFLDALELISLAGSLGDAHSLALAPAFTTHRQFAPAERAAAGIPDGFIRLSVGLEDPKDLLADLDAALGA